MVTETLKNGIFAQIDTSKEFHFDFDFKSISFIEFNLTHQKFRAGEKFLYFRKKGKTTPKSH